MPIKKKLGHIIVNIFAVKRLRSKKIILIGVEIKLIKALLEEHQ